MRLLRSLSFRLALMYAALFSFSVVALLALYYWMSVQVPLQDARALVRSEAGRYAEIHARYGPAPLVEALNVRAGGAADSRKPFHAFIDSRGRVVSANLPSWPDYAGTRWLRVEADRFREGLEEDYEALVLDRRLAGGARLLIGRDVGDVDEKEEQLAAAALWILLGTLFLSVLGGGLMSHAIGRRIEAINSAARTVMTGDLSARVAVRGTGDDFDRLGETLNLMFSRVEELVESVRRVSDSIAHELRSPLARLLVDLDALQQENDGGRRQVLLDQAASDARRLHRLFDALLRIARIESGRHAADRVRVDLVRLIDDAVEFYQPDAEAKGVELATGPAAGLAVVGDPDLLFQAIANLIDNALKFTPAGGSVAVALQQRGGNAVITVSDTGPGIAPADQGHLTERFYRSESARDIPGEGLGLSLVGAVAARHKAALRFFDNDPGTLVELAIPLAGEAAGDLS